MFAQWALSKRIRTTAQLALEVSLIGKSPAARYQRIAGLVKRLHELGMSNRAIGRELGVHHTDVAKALALGRGCDTVGIAPPRP